jgi:hypothetical protein
MTRRDPALLLLARCSEHQFSSKTARPKPFTSCKAVEPFLGGDHSGESFLKGRYLSDVSFLKPMLFAVRHL